MNYSDPIGTCPFIPQLCTVALGAALGAGGQLVVNALTDRPLGEGVGRAALIGGAIGLTFGLAAPEAAAGLLTRGATQVVGGGAAVAGSKLVFKVTSTQGRHIPGAPNFIEGRSILTANPQALLDEFAGTGQRLSGVLGGPGKERVNFGQVIGQINLNGVLVNTTNGIIHYNASGGAHIVPARP